MWYSVDRNGTNFVPGVPVRAGRPRGCVCRPAGGLAARAGPGVQPGPPGGAAVPAHPGAACAPLPRTLPLGGPIPPVRAARHPHGQVRCLLCTALQGHLLIHGQSNFHNTISAYMPFSMQGVSATHARSVDKKIKELYGDKTGCMYLAAVSQKHQCFYHCAELNIWMR